METCCTSAPPKVRSHIFDLGGSGLRSFPQVHDSPRIVQPIVHAAVSANTFAVYGTGQVKELTELVPGILNQLGPDSLASLRKLAESYQAIQQNQKRPSAGDDDDDDDDDVPDLVENFDGIGPDLMEEPDAEKKQANLEELN